MNIPSLHKHLAVLQQEVNDRHCARALHVARTVPMSDFAAVLWETSPHPRRGWCLSISTY